MIAPRARTAKRPEMDSQNLLMITHSYCNFVIALILLAQWVPLAKGAVDGERVSGPQIAERGLNHRVWRNVVEMKDGTDQTRLRTSEVIELASGMHRFSEQGWVETSDLIELTQNGGAVANRSAHSAAFAANANSLASLQIGLVDKTLKFHFSGLFFQDGTGTAVFFPVRDSIGELHGPNTVIYRNVVDGLPVDLVIVNSRSGFSHSIAFRKQLGFTMADLGLNEATARILAYTSFDEGPEPEVSTGAFRESEQQILDDLLDWGVCKMGRGLAFSIDGQVPGEINVAKTWLRGEDGRRFIVESLPFSLVKPHLAALPAPEQAAVAKKPTLLQAAALPRRPLDQRLLAKLALNVPAAPKQTASLKRIQTAKLDLPKKGFLVDFEACTSPETNKVFEPFTTYYIAGTYDLYGNGNVLNPCVIKFAPTNSAKLVLHGKLTCRTEPGSPAILTARDENIGEPIGSATLSGYYADTAIQFTDFNISDLSNLRISHAKRGIYYQDNDSTASTSKHLQITHCETAIALSASDPTFRNILVYDVQTNLFNLNSLSTVRYEHLTLNRARYLAAGATHPDILLTNSILCAVTNFSSSYYGYKTNSSSNVEVVSDPATIFQTIGGGSHYLLPQYSPVASSTVNPSLFQDFRQFTVRAPLVLTNDIVTNTTLRLIAERMADNLVCGYAYPALDFVFGGIGLSNATLTIQAGVGVGNYSADGSTSLQLRAGSVINAIGSCTNLVKMWRYNAVQEQSTTNWMATPGNMITPINGSPSPAPSGAFRFVDFSIPYQSGYHLDGQAGESSTFWFRDCQFHGGNIQSLQANLFFTNALFEAVSFNLSDSAAAFDLVFRNGLFYRGNQLFNHVGAGTWKYRDNYFDRTTITNSNVDGDYNGYVTGANKLSPAGGHDYTGSQFTWVAGPLSRYYQPTNTALLNLGSTSSTNVGLYWFCTVTNASLCESNSTVDIGFHLTGLASNGLDPRDDDSDGALNVDEDSNSSGSVTTGETNLASSDTDGDGISDWVETILGRNPLVAGTTNDFSGTLNLRVFTPLR